jgi:hypothetical protein
LQPECDPLCTIELEHVVTLSDNGIAGSLPVQAISVVSDRLGRYVLISRDRRLLAYSRSGQLDAVSIGDPRSPFQSLSRLLKTPDGTLSVYDGRRGILAALKDDLTFRDTRATEYRPALILPDGLYVYDQHIRTASLAGHPLHIIDTNGRVVRSFGNTDGLFRADQPLRHRRIVSPRKDGTVWAVAPGKYVFENWDPATGQLREVVRVRSDWFRESLRFSPPDSRPTAYIQGFWEEGPILWVILQDADHDWSPPNGQSHGAFDPHFYEARRDTVVEAIDISTGSVIASHRVDFILWAQNPESRLLASWHQANSGRGEEVRVWRPRLAASSLRRDFVSR